MDTLKTAAVVVAIIGAVTFMLWSCVKAGVDNQIDRCEEANEDYFNNGGPQPSILTEDWCFEHLTGLETDE